jgi:hypothetical protein
MTEKAIVTTKEAGLGSQLVTSELDQKLAALYKKQLPYGEHLSDDAALALATFTRAHDLDARNGEAYFMIKPIKDPDNNWEIVGYEEMGVYAGIKGVRKLANRQLREVDPQAHYTTEFTKSTPEACGLKHKAKDIVLVMRCELRDSVSMGRYIVNVTKLVSQAGYTKQEAEALLGKPPIWVGYGVVTHKELRWISMTPLALANKRAESDASRQRFSLPFATEGLAEDLQAEIAASVMNQKAEAPEVQVVHRDPDEILGELGYGEPDEEAAQDGEFTDVEEAEEVEPDEEAAQTKTEATAESIKQWILKKAEKRAQFEPSKAQRNLLRHGLELLFAGNENAEKYRHDVLHYISGHESTNDVDGSLLKALLEDWLAISIDNDTGEYSVSAAAVKGAAKMLKEQLTQEGQQELPL